MIRTARSFCLGPLLLILLSAAAFAFCNLPQPRLVRAEYSQSDAVVIAHLVKSQHFEPKDDQDYDLYTFQVETILRGSIPRQFVLWDENSSARLTFDVLRGQKYLLFVNHGPDKDKQWWTADDCGHSGPVSNRSKTLNQIERIPSMRGARITGEVSSQPNVPLANAIVVATRKVDGRHFETKTRRNGDFDLYVPAGEYSVKVTAAGKTFVTHWLSYEDAESVRLEDGACAQIMFVPFDSTQARSNTGKR